MQGLQLQNKYMVDNVSIDPTFYSVLENLIDENGADGKIKPPKLDEIKRWYELFNHPKQLELINDHHVQFKIIPAGRRSGKTERAKRYIVSRAMHTVGRYLVAAPTMTQTIKIYWDDIKLLALASTCPKVSETQHIIWLHNGSTLELNSLDNPARVEGIPWAGAIIDEAANCAEDMWGEHLYPAFSTYNPSKSDSDKPWCWLLGVPEGQNFYYKLAEQTKDNNNWQTYHWPSSDILPDETIDEARKTLSEHQFRVEYEGAFLSHSSTIYNNYSDANNLSITLKPDETIYFSSDFNFVPCSSILCIVRGSKENPKIFAFDEIIVDHANSQIVAEIFVSRYANHKGKIVMMADASGQAGEKHGLNSSILAMQKVFDNAGILHYERDVPKANPAIKDRIQSVLAKIKSADGKIHLYVDKVKCPVLDDGLRSTQFKKGSLIHQEQTYSSHVTDALGYFIHRLWPTNREVKEFGKEIDFTPIARPESFAAFNRKQLV